MKFDVVIGNPPYNNDLYLDFVQTGYNLLKDDGVMVQITPAKWQAKGGKKNEDFRANIVPHMKEIMFFRNTPDVFDINEMAGICYYSLDKDIHDTLLYSAFCRRNSNFSCEKEIHTSKLPLLPNKIQQIITKCNSNNTSVVNKCVDLVRCYYVNDTYHGKESGDLRMLSGSKYEYVNKSDLKRQDNLEKYKIVTNVMPGVVAAQFSDQEKTLGMNALYIVSPNEIYKGSYMALYFCDSQVEAEAFVSYLSCKLSRFLHFCGIQATTVNLQNWRFVPDPGQFDHIFTDDELYKKYNLTQDEINIIESVIKERK